MALLMICEVDVKLYNRPLRRIFFPQSAHFQVVVHFDGTVA